MASKLEYMDLNKSVYLGSLDLQHWSRYFCLLLSMIRTGPALKSMGLL